MKAIINSSEECEKHCNTFYQQLKNLFYVELNNNIDFERSDSDLIISSLFNSYIHICSDLILFIISNCSDKSKWSHLRLDTLRTFIKNVADLVPDGERLLEILNGEDVFSCNNTIN